MEQKEFTIEGYENKFRSTKVLDQWIPVKEVNKEVYYPIGIEDDYKALKSLIEWFIENVIRPVF